MEASTKTARIKMLASVMFNNGLSEVKRKYGMVPALFNCFSSALHHNHAAGEQAEALIRENGSQGFQLGRNALTQQKGKRKEENAKVRPRTSLLFQLTFAWACTSTT